MSCRNTLLAFLTLSALVGGAWAEDGLAVITGPNRPAIAFSHANLQDIFLKRIQVDDSGNPLVAKLGVHGINMEGKETRFGLAGTALFTTATTGTTKASYIWSCIVIS